MGSGAEPGQHQVRTNLYTYWKSADFSVLADQAELSASFLCRRSRSDRQGGQGDVVYPIGYSEKPVPDTSIQETDKNLVEKASRVESFSRRELVSAAHI